MKSVAVSPPQDRELLAAELERLTPVRTVGNLTIYDFHASEGPKLLAEIGRVREIAFRSVGGGTGKPSDVDRFDTGSPTCRQLLAWDPEQREIVACYRYVDGSGVAAPEVELPTGALFGFSEFFCSEVLPATIELGRSVVNRSASRAVSGLHAIWAGLGALVVRNPHARYFFGKVTTPGAYPARARTLLYRYLLDCWGRDASWVSVRREHAVEDGVSHKRDRSGECPDRRDAYAYLTDQLRTTGATVPPLLASYLKLTDTMRYFGTARNPDFGGLEESAILMTIADIKQGFRKTYIESYRAGD